MYTIDDLNVRLLSELKEIAEGMGVKNAKKLTKQDLVYKILDQQAVSGDAAPASKQSSAPEADAERKMRPRRRENVAPPAPKTENELSSEELLDSINLDFDNSVAKFEDKEENFNEKSENESANTDTSFTIFMCHHRRSSYLVLKPVIQ
jgi:transcription termination factor Rho